MKGQIPGPNTGGVGNACHTCDALNSQTNASQQSIVAQRLNANDKYRNTHYVTQDNFAIFLCGLTITAGDTEWRDPKRRSPRKTADK
jgi:hypothetical protein